MAVSRRVLIADDDELVRDLVEAKLVKLGWNVSVARDGNDALAIARQLLPDAVVLDWMMPGRSGVEVCRELRRDPSTKDLRIILVTAKATEDDIAAAFDEGADDYLTKPFDITELDHTLRRLLQL